MSSGPRVFIAEMGDNFTYSVARNVARKLPVQKWDDVGSCEWNRCITSALMRYSDSDWAHHRKYGNKRFEKGRRRHR